MSFNPVITKEIAALPPRRDDAHKGEVGRVAIIGGCSKSAYMVGAPTLTANGALRGGAGLVRLFVPKPLLETAAVLCPCATLQALPAKADAICEALEEFAADVVALGPGLGNSLTPKTVVEVIQSFAGRLVVDADGLNLLANAGSFTIPEPRRVVMTPHLGEARRLLIARGRREAAETTSPDRRTLAGDLVDTFGCTIVLKGSGTIATDGRRMYINETGNSGMATAGTGDVLTGIIAALLGQGMETLEASILGVYLHGLAGDFAVEELGRYSLTATDLLEYLPEAFLDYESSD